MLFLRTTYDMNDFFDIFESREKTEKIGTVNYYYSNQKSTYPNFNSPQIIRFIAHIITQIQEILSNF